MEQDSRTRPGSPLDIARRPLDDQVGAAEGMILRALSHYKAGQWNEAQAAAQIAQAIALLEDF